jgi:hypothetical protein
MNLKRNSCVLQRPRSFFSFFPNKAIVDDRGGKRSDFTFNKWVKGNRKKNSLKRGKDHILTKMISCIYLKDKGNQIDDNLQLDLYYYTLHFNSMHSLVCPLELIIWNFGQNFTIWTQWNKEAKSIDAFVGSMLP